MRSALNVIKALFFMFCVLTLLTMPACGQERPGAAANKTATQAALAQAYPLFTDVLASQQGNTAAQTLTAPGTATATAVPRETPIRVPTATVQQPMVIQASPTQQPPTSTPTSVATNTQVSTPLPIPNFYIVRQGQTLEQIATLFGTTPQAILNMNGLADKSAVYPGQSLRIPAKPNPLNPSGMLHVVTAGQTLFAISRIYNVPVATIAAANGLTGDAMENLLPGQRLIIPGVSR